MHSVQIFQQLLLVFGPQGWWPTTPPGEVVPRYYPDRLPDRQLNPSEQWEVVVGSILVQNTNWNSNAEKALIALNENAALGLSAIAAVDEAGLAPLIRSAGFLNQKAKRIKFLASYLLKQYGGDISVLLGKPAPALRRELLSLPGIGEETADSILLYAGGYPVFIADSYSRRIYVRIGRVEDTVSYAQLQALVTAESPMETAFFNEFHALLVRHAVTSCRKVPRCAECPLREWCGYGRSHPIITAPAQP